MRQKDTNTDCTPIKINRHRFEKIDTDYLFNFCDIYDKKSSHFQERVYGITIYNAKYNAKKSCKIQKNIEKSSKICYIIFNKPPSLYVSNSICVTGWYFSLWVKIIKQFH